MNRDQVRNSLIRPVLMNMGAVTPCKYTAAAEDLLMGTWAHESAGGEYLKQVGGPARGIFQIEPATARSVLENYVEHREAFRDFVAAHMTAQPLEDQLITNLALQVILARLVYYPKPHPLPEAGNVTELAWYWKTHYNTSAGRGTVQKFIDDYHRYVL